MGYDDREGIGMFGADMNEVDVDAVDVGDELRKSIHPRFDLAPVVGRPPIVDEGLELRQRDTLGLIGNSLAIRPSRRQNAPPKLDKVLLRHGNVEGVNCAFARGRRCTQRKHARGNRR
jgi:hypothetical protein